jgi:hypothetical protein
VVELDIAPAKFSEETPMIRKIVTALLIAKGNG